MPWMLNVKIIDPAGDFKLFGWLGAAGPGAQSRKHFETR
jgi:hypothetical protein